MRYLDYTAPCPTQNLAMDEALLEWCEQGNEPVIRFWEPQDYFVVVGYAERVALEVNRAACCKENISILRRCSGGGTVLQGPGCLNYALVLRINDSPALQSITATNCFIMRRHQRALAAATGKPVMVHGFTDLACNNLKFSGNSQRRRRECLLFHGTFLLDLDLSRIDRYLNHPTREPAYRQKRRHHEFLRCLNVSSERVKSALRAAWDANEPLPARPDTIVQRLVQEKYGREEWCFGVD